MISVHDRVENIVEKGENADNHNIFKRFLSQGRYKVGIVAQMVISVFDRVQNIVEKGENAGTGILSYSLNVFLRLLSLGLLKVGIVW